MNLINTLKTEESKGEKSNDAVPMVYSPKFEREIPLNYDEPMGDIQQYNVGLAPGSWY